MNFLKLTSDFVFKLLFTKNTDLLVNLLNSVLDFPPDEAITSLDILNPELPRNFKKDKSGYLDVRATNKNGAQFIIEVQNVPEEFYMKRALFYWSQVFLRQIKKGETYVVLDRVYSINFLNFDQFKERKNYLSNFVLLNTEDPNIQLTDLMEFTFVELKKFPKQNPQDLTNDLELWLYIFCHSQDLTEEDMKTIIDKNPLMKKTFKELKSLSDDEKTRIEYEDHERWQISHNSELTYAERKGRNEGFAEGEAIGEARGKAEGKAEGLKSSLKQILSLKEDRKVLTKALEERITQENNVENLESWIKKALKGEDF